MTIRGAIFDIDGTLVDSNDAHARSWAAALAEAGHPVPYDDVRRLIGAGGDKLLPKLTGLAQDSPPGKAIGERRKEIFTKELLPTLKPFPKVRELLHTLRAQGLKLAVASSAEKDELKALLRIAGVDDLLHTTTSSSDAPRSKPDPDIVQTALQRLGCSAEEAVMIGDTPYDVQAAGRVGIAAIAVRCGGWDLPDLAGAIALYDDPADLLRHWPEALQRLATAPPAASGG